MGVHIKGMDMPKDCKECFMCLQCDGHHFEMEQDADGFWMPKGVKDDCLFIEAEEPKHGEWEEKEAFLNVDRTPIIEEWQSARCSVCHKYHTTPYAYYFNDYNFCPNCGAQMKGADDEQMD